MRLLPRLLLPLCLTAGAWAQDVTVSTVGIGDDFDYHASYNGIAAYSFATTACNAGDVPLSWNDAALIAPVIGTNLFRVTEGRIEQLGYAFVKYGFCASDAGGGGCAGQCQKIPGCDWLGISCADTYSAQLNDGRFGGGKWEVDPVTGAWPTGPPTGPTGSKKIRGRIQVKETEMAVPGDVYLAEAQYLHPEDQPAGNVRNNWAWRELDVPSIDVLKSAGPTNIGQPAIFAWQAVHPDVLITELAVEDEGGPGIHGWIFVGSRAIDLGGGLWRYEYAVQNGNSARAVGSFAVRLPCDGGGLAVSDPTFRKVRHHSGSPYNNMKWDLTQTADQMAWATQEDHGTNPFANAVRWGELYNFGFTADRAPGAGRADLGLFVPGAPAGLEADVIAPGGDFVGYCSANPNSTGLPAALTAFGSPWVDDEALVLDASDLPPDSLGYFMMSQSQDFVPLFGGSQGNLCLGQPIYRFGLDVLDAGADGHVQFAPDFAALPLGQVFQPGETWHFQYWYRDANPGATSNTTAGVSVGFCP